MPDSSPPPRKRPQKPPGYWQVWDNLARELTAFMLERGEPGQMPSKRTLTHAGAAADADGLPDRRTADALSVRFGFALDVECARGAV